MWETVEKACPGFSRNDVTTWSLYKSAGKYGLSTRGPCFHRQLVLNRQNNLNLKKDKFLTTLQSWQAGGSLHDDGDSVLLGDPMNENSRNATRLNFQRRTKRA